jgi:hypothetical protein
MRVMNGANPSADSQSFPAPDKKRNITIKVGEPLPAGETPP